MRPSGAAQLLVVVIVTDGRRKMVYHVPDYLLGKRVCTKDVIEGSINQ